jgi:3-phenylpropionate/cinnamic acid dioxygenase small subunit
MTRQQQSLGGEIHDFLVEESAALDEHRYADWLDMLTDDFVYQIPVAHSREDPGLAPYSEELCLAHESKSFLSMRFDRIKSDFAWAERPAAFGRHFVSNLRIRHVDDEAGRWWVSTNVLLTRARQPDPMSISSAERRDVLVRTASGWLLAQRTVFLDTEVPTDSQLVAIY